MKLLLALVMMMFAANAADAACTASVARNWAHYRVEAFSLGSDCKNAVLTLIIRADDNFPVFANAYVAEQLSSFYDASIADSAAMKTKLQEWISGANFKTSADQLDTSGEFPFKPSSELAEGMFSDAQKDRAQLFCFIQGSESATCLGILSDSGVYNLGVQNFPG